MTSLPSEMAALEMTAYHDDLGQAIASLHVVRKPLPTLRKGQVLVRMAAAPCNPSDTLLLTGAYGVRKMLPTVPGWEGAGTVTASGGGWLANRLVGRRVACGDQSEADGTWAEYFVCPAMRCVPLSADVDFDQGACLLVNPLSALGLMHRARRGGHRAAVQTAGASQLGRMLVRVARRERYPLVSIVRREEQAESLRALGAKHVLNSASPDFDASLRSECMRLRATVAFDAVAGAMTGRLLKALPPDSTVIVYGALDHEDCRAIDPIDLLFQNKRVEGFYLGGWIDGLGLPRLLLKLRRAQRLVVEGVLSSTVQARVPLADVPAQLGEWTRRASQGKVLIVP